jgi:hypothetical protein
MFLEEKQPINKFSKISNAAQKQPSGQIHFSSGKIVSISISIYIIH